MKKIKLLLTAIVLTLSSTAQAQMVLEYNIATANTAIALPFGLFGTVNVSINWGDGSALETVTSGGDKSHTYSTIGTKTVTITGTLTEYGTITNSTGNARLTKVTSWDGLGLTSLFDAFNGATMLTQVPTSLPATVTNLSYMFQGATAFNQAIGTWNTAAVTDMTYMFYDATAFNQPIGTWNTAAVTDMYSMFFGATSFNQAIGTWNTGAVTNMAGMFYDATAFNQAIGTWNTGAVTNMNGMFFGATSFNQAIGTWNTGAVTNMNGMFSNATAFNQAIGTWNTSAVTSMYAMFSNATAFNQPIGTWNISNVSVMYEMFKDATAFNQPIGTWNTAAVTSMYAMFSNATAFNQAIGTWNIAAVTDMSQMFKNTALCTDNYDATLNGWAPQTVNKVEFDGGTSKYSNASANARATIISKGWTITDAGSGTTSASKCSITTATLEPFATDAIKIYPNPAADKLQVNFTAPITETLTYSVYSNTGVLILEKVTQMNGSNLAIELGNMPQGLYIIKINTQDKSIAKTFVKE
jgi:surface protein